jgi:hypothetical protein
MEVKIKIKETENEIIYDIQIIPTMMPKFIEVKIPSDHLNRTFKYKVVEKIVFYPKRLTYLRMVNNMTINELLDLLYLDDKSTFVLEVENGITIPSKKMIKKLCKIFKVSSDFFSRYKFDINVLGDKFYIVPDK